jgi:hypothetical protein
MLVSLSSCWEEVWYNSKFEQSQFQNWPIFMILTTGWRLLGVVVGKYIKVIIMLSFSREWCLVTDQQQLGPGTHLMMMMTMTSLLKIKGPWPHFLEFWPHNRFNSFDFLNWCQGLMYFCKGTRGSQRFYSRFKGDFKQIVLMSTH